MPKIIPDLRNRILVSARKQLLKEGFSGLSLRTIAKECGTAVGTTYNYFSSKADLVHAVMQEDWDCAMKEAGEDSPAADTPQECVVAIYRAINNFTNNYKLLMNQQEARVEYSEVIHTNHAMLVNDIKNVLQKTLIYFGYEESESLLSLASAMILSASIHENVQEEDFRVLINRVFEGMKPVQH